MNTPSASTNSNPDADEGSLDDIDAEECWHLLAT